MTIKGRIIDLTKDGFSAQLIKEQMPTVSVGYIYKVRSELKKKSPNVLRTKLQKKIDIMKHTLSPAEIADRLGCSKQYVYKVISKRNAKKSKSIYTVYKEDDEYYTPLYAVKPIEKYLKRNSIIWCPFDKDESIFVRYFIQQGHIVINTHIDYGNDFFKTDPPNKCDYIISNPPFSIKTEVFTRLMKLGVPYAMLVNTEKIFNSKKRFNIFKEGVEQLNFPSRVGYLRDYDESAYMGPAPFGSGYICKGILPEKLMFEDFDKTEILFCENQTLDDFD